MSARSAPARSESVRERDGCRPDPELHSPQTSLEHGRRGLQERELRAEGGLRPAAQSPERQSLLSDIRGGRAQVHTLMHMSGDALEGESHVQSPGLLYTPREPTG